MGEWPKLIEPWAAEYSPVDDQPFIAVVPADLARELYETIRPFAEHAPWLEPDEEEAASIREIGLDPAEGIPDLSPKADPPTLADWRRARATLVRYEQEVGDE